MHIRTRTTRRRAFSLIELMVAMTLTLFVMVILTQAFVTSLATFSGLKSIGELQANLRTVTSLLQADLAADHFEGKRRLSSPDLLTLPPTQGFFAIYQGTGPVIADAAPYPAYVIEGNETTVVPPVAGMLSCRATNHVLYFTVKLRGNRPEDFMSTPVPAGSPLAGLSTTFFGQPLDGRVTPPAGFYNGQWAEVCWFLVQTGSTLEPANPQSLIGTPVYALYRAPYLLVPNPPASIKPAPAPTPYPGVSTNVINPGTLAFNAPDDVAGVQIVNNVPVNAAGNPVSQVRTLNAGFAPFPIRPSDQQPLQPGVPPSGATLVLSNVTSFQVQIFAQAQAPAAAQPPLAGFVWNSQLGWVSPDFIDPPASFDSSNPAGYNILAVKVTVRIWDPTSSLSRQVTIIQDM